MSKKFLLSYKSIIDLNNDILKNLSRFPHNVDLIVGIPRSGMLPANIISLYLQKPYTDIDSFIDGRIYGTGERGKNLETDRIKSVLVIDDSLNSGNALNKAKSKLAHLVGKYEFIYGAIYVIPEMKDKIDCYAKIVPLPRIFQWNFFHHDLISKSCFDIDGVLCPDPPIDDDSYIYANYIATAPPLYIPSKEIDTIVTCRLEKYRSITEKWLNDNGVKYKTLIMLPFSTRDERLKWGKHAQYKARIYKESNCRLFVESSLSQARTIHNKTGKMVFCTETFSFVGVNMKMISLLKKIRYFMKLFKKYFIQ